MIASGSLNVMIERVAYRPVREREARRRSITGVGMSFILQNVGLSGGASPAHPDLIRAQERVTPLSAS
jgi:branched-chain amino acid transport system permease protein